MPYQRRVDKQYLNWMIKSSTNVSSDQSYWFDIPKMGYEMMGMALSLYLLKTRQHILRKASDKSPSRYTPQDTWSALLNTIKVILKMKKG